MIFVIIFVISISGVIGRHIGDENLKNTWKSIESEDGDVIYCIDMYKQPSLNHPLLKHHIIQVASSFGGEESFRRKKQIQQSWHKSGSCPDGTVPILKHTKNLMSNGESYHLPKGPKVITHERVLDYNSDTINVAVGYVYDSYDGPFYGGVGSMSVWNISVENEEYSKNYVLAANAYEANSTLLQTMDIVNFVAAGWIVDVGTFGDHHPRLYAEWRTENAGCYNMFCSGFIQISNKVALGGILSNVSVYNDPNQLQTIDVHVYKEVDQGNWWVVLGDEMVGYWPKALFDNNFSQAEVFVFGGEVRNNGQTGNHSSTQMGSGVIPTEAQQYGRSADISGIVIRETDNNYHDHQLRYYATFPDCYSYYNGSTQPPPGINNATTVVLYYGGSGGSSCEGTI